MIPIRAEDREYLDHMLDCLRKTVACCKGDRKRFEEDYIITNAALHLLQLMAQSAMRLSAETISQMEGVDIGRIRGFRNIVVHEYLGGIDYDIVWGVIAVELPILERAILKIYSPGETRK